MRAAPHAAAFAVGAIAVFQAHVALGPERVADGAVWVPIVVLAVGCAVSFLAWGTMTHWTAYHVRELVGTGFVIAGLFSIMAFWDAESDHRIEGWQWVTFVIAFFAFFLHSQQSFMMYLVVFASLLLVGQSFAPGAPAALAFAIGACVMMAALAHREKAERFPSGARSFGLRPPLRAVTPVLVALATLFAVFTALKPPAIAVTAEDWIRWFREGPPTEGLGGGTATLPDPAAPTLDRSPFSAGGETAEQPAGPATIGFEDDLKFGDLPGAPSDAIAMYVSAREAGGEHVDRADFDAYWATAAVCDYDGRRWTGDPREPQRLDGAGGKVVVSGGRGERIEQRFILSPLKDRSLFALYPVETIGFDSVGVDREGMLSRTERFVTWFKYSVTSRRVIRPHDRSIAAHPDRRYYELPPSVKRDAAFQSLARRARAGRSDVERIAIVQEILKSYTYTLKPGFDEGADPTLEFLKRRRGYCQHFASAMALILRELRIPTRIVLGFAGGDWDYEGKFYVVRRRHAHAWVEVHFDAIGWVVYDPAAGPAEAYADAPPVVDPKPDDPTPVDPKPDDPKPVDPKPDDPTPVDPKPDDPKPVDPKPDDPTPVDPKPDDPKPVDPTPPRPVDPRPPDPTPPQPIVPTPPRPDPEERFDSMWDGVQNALVTEASPTGGGPADAPPPTGPAAVGVDPVRSSLEFLAGSVLRDAAALALAATVAIGLARLLGRRRKGAEPARAPAIESSPAAPVRYLIRGTSEYEIVRVYLRMLAALAARGLSRAPAETATEFAARHPGGAVATLTDLFVRARYGPDELGDDDMRRARRLLDEILA